MALQNLVRTYDYGALTDDMIWDCLVCGIRDDTVRKFLLQKSALFFSACIAPCRASELATAQLRDITTVEPPQLHLVKANTKNS